MPLLCEGETVEYNQKHALEVLTETEAVMLDMLVSKVQQYSEDKMIENFHENNAKCTVYAHSK